MAGDEEGDGECVEDEGCDDVEIEPVEDELGDRWEEGRDEDEGELFHGVFIGFGGVVFWCLLMLGCGKNVKIVWGGWMGLERVGFEREDREGLEGGEGD